jgi:hypothetical protein
MNTTTTKIAGEAMTDEQIIEMAKAHCVDATRISTVLSFARALLASQAAVLQKPYGWVGAGNYWTADELTAKQVGIRTDTPMVPVYVATTAPAQSCEQAEFGTARERFISGAPVQASEHVLELARQALAARDSDTRTDDEKIAAAVDFICDTRLDQPVKCGDAEQADEAVTDATERMKALWGVLMCQVVETSSESYLSLRCVGMPPTDDEFALAVNRAIDAARAKDSK